MATFRSAFGRPAILCALAVSALSCASSDRSESTAKEVKEPASSVSADPTGPIVVDVDEPVYKILAELIAASDVGVHGTVSSMNPGREIGPEGHQDQYTEFTISVDEVLFGPSLTSVVLEVQAEMNGRPVIMEGLEPPKLGSSGVWLLDHVAPEFESDTYVMTNTQARYFDDGNRGFVSPPADSLTAQLYALSPEQLVRQIKATAAPG